MSWLKFGRRWLTVAALISVLATAPPVAADQPFDAGKYLVLCYHSIQPDPPPGDPYTISRRQFVEQLEYLRAGGYTPVSLDDVVAARSGRRALPPKAVLLTFDDAYRSYADFVAPLLRQLGYPSVLAVVGAWIENGPPAHLPEPLMRWDQIKTLAGQPLVEIASHSFGLHRGIQYTPQGNVGPAAGIRAYLNGAYESEAEFRQRLAADFARQQQLFARHIGRQSRILVWPYGHYTRFGMDLARRHGFRFMFTLDEKELGLADINRPEEINRVLVGSGAMDEFIAGLPGHHVRRRPLRAAQVDLDLIYDPQSAAKTDDNLGRLIDRMVALKVNAVFLQAFSDPDGSGNIRSVYFRNRVLPVKADIFGHAAHQMTIRDIRVYAWMPTLGIVFPDPDFNQRFRVREYHQGKVEPSRSWYRRLTPFSDEVIRRVQMLYEDLAAHSQVYGVLFQDDAYLTDGEDVHPLAVAAFEAELGRRVQLGDLIRDPALADRWTTFKTDRLMAFVQGLQAAFRRYRPDAVFARNLYAPVLDQPESQRWFAQNYAQFLKAYDWVVVMAYTRMEEAGRPLDWLAGLVKKAGAFAGGLERTVFKLQAYDWEKERWRDDGRLLAEMRAVLSAGGRHLAYYPDNLDRQRPNIDIIQMEMSTRDLPAAR